MAENIQGFQAEIQALEAKLEAKKREMAESGQQQTEKHIFKAVVREHTGHESTASINVSGAAPQVSTTTAAATPTKEEEAVLDQLISHAFSKGIVSAVNEAKKMNIPYLVDLLHDRLTDEYYEKLLASRKVMPE